MQNGPVPGPAGNREEPFVSKPSDLVQETLDMLILRILALQPPHALDATLRFTR
jgi:hypothetical protein